LNSEFKNEAIRANLQVTKRILAFAYGLINNYEKVASAKQHTQFKNRVQTPYPIKDQNGQNG